MLTVKSEMSYGFQVEKMKSKLIATSIALVLFFGGFFVWQTLTTANTANCITVLVDYGILKNGETTTQCISASGKTMALDVLKSAGLSIEGTDKYQSQIVCRVNSLPSATSPIGVKYEEDYVESCSTMPASFAYWAVLVKMKSEVPNPLDVSAKWNWAQTGIDQVSLKPGDSIGLVFADNDNVRFPK